MKTMLNLAPLALASGLLILVGCSTTTTKTTKTTTTTTTTETGHTIAAAPAAPATSIVVELEDGEFFEAQAAADHDGFTGTGFADFMRWEGAWVKNVFEAPAAGTYDMTLRFANGSFEPRPMKIIVNDLVIMESLIFPPTEDEIWDNYRTQTVYNVPLQAGANTLTFISLEEDGPNLDSATFTPSN